ncbi:MAG: HYR domain-containing protein [candidate division Zixibacteria bacterium]|nr:HYR domain-containing protein [candidate division Zixibacteria bacterium]
MKNKRFSYLAGMLGLAFSFLFYPSLFAAPKKAGTPAIAMGQPVTGTPGKADRRVVVNVADLLQAADVGAPAVETGKTVPDFMPLPAKGPVPPEAVGRWQETGTAPPQLPTAIASNGTPAPSASFFGLGDNNAAIPPDVHGAAGPNHLMITLNTQVRIQNRNGSNVSTVSLDFFWSGTGAAIVFDPKVLYDPYANRWMFTAVSNPQSSTSSVLMGVSQSSDPSGLWNLYRIDTDPTDRVWADYPSMGFNKNWIVVNVNMFTVAGQDTFIRSDNFAFNKDSLYAGGTGLFTRLSDLTGGGAITPALTYDTTVSTMYLLEDWVGDDFEAGYLRLSRITGAVGAEVYTPGVAFPSTTSLWEDIPSVGFADFAPQLGTTRKIVCNDARAQNTVYRNGALWFTHTVFLPVSAGPANPSTRSAVQWWKITPAGVVSQRGRMDDPTGNLFYAFPSIAVNKNDAVLIGYSRFSANQFASGNYAYRTSSDPPNILRNDTVLRAGEAKYDKDFNSGFNRWGDYTNTVVDPVNDVDMWTIQEYAAPRVSGFDRWATWWGKIPDPSDACFNDTVNPAVSCPADTVVFRSPSECDSVVADFSPTASDSCSAVSSVCTPPSGSKFPLGATSVTCVATDGSGNQDSCSFTVIVYKGDLNGSGGLSGADIVSLVTCTFQSIGNCDLCVTDINCSGGLSGADIVTLVAATFQSQFFPCSP